MAEIDRPKYDAHEAPTEEFDRIQPAPPAHREPETVSLLAASLVVVAVVVWTLAAQSPQGLIADIVTWLIALVIVVLLMLMFVYGMARIVKRLIVR